MSRGCCEGEKASGVGRRNAEAKLWRKRDGLKPFLGRVRLSRKGRNALVPGLALHNSADQVVGHTWCRRLCCNNPPAAQLGPTLDGCPLCELPFSDSEAELGPPVLRWARSKKQVARLGCTLLPASLSVLLLHPASSRPFDPPSDRRVCRGVLLHRRRLCRVRATFVLLSTIPPNGRLWTRVQGFFGRISRLRMCALSSRRDSASDLLAPSPSHSLRLGS